MSDYKAAVPEVLGHWWEYSWWPKNNSQQEDQIYSLWKVVYLSPSTFLPHPAWSEKTHQVISRLPFPTVSKQVSVQNHSYEMSFPYRVTVNQTRFPTMYERFCLKTRFETEAQANWEMAYKKKVNHNGIQIPLQFVSHF